jgi:hypothetical protein
MTSKMKHISFFALAMAIAAGLAAQSTSMGNWLIYFGNQSFHEKWNWHNEIQHRNYNAFGDLEQLLVRTGLGYNLSPNNNNLLLGYAFILSEPYDAAGKDKTRIDEHRIYQQFISRQHFGRVYLQHRYRFEQRFFEDDFKTRFRYFVGVNVPVNQSTLEKNALYLSVYNEVFINGQKTAFDRDRIYGALGYSLTDLIRVELGAMSQILQSASRGQFQIVLFNNLPFQS